MNTLVDSIFTGGDDKWSEIVQRRVVCWYVPQYITMNIVREGTSAGMTGMYRTYPNLAYPPPIYRVFGFKVNSYLAHPF